MERTPGFLPAGLFVALAAAMSLSAWSLFWVGHHYGLPLYVAALTSAGFDGAALAASGYAVIYVAAGLAGWLPRVTVLVLGLLSAFLNAQHAVLARDPAQAWALYAAPPIAVLALFEIHMRFKTGLAGRNTQRPARVPRATRGTARSDGGGQRGDWRKKKAELEGMRKWAAGRGYELAARGPVPREIRDEYRSVRELR